MNARMQHIKKGVKTTYEGWVDVDERNIMPDTVHKNLTGLFVSKTGASNIANVERDLKQLNGYKVKVTLEVLDTPENRSPDEMIPGWMQKITLAAEQEKKAHERFRKGEGTVCKDKYPYSAQGDHAPCDVCGHEGRWHTFRYGQSVCYACSKDQTERESKP